MPRPRVLVVSEALQPSGGGYAVVAWLVEALKVDHQVTLMTLRDIDLAAINSMFGTKLSAGEFEHRRVLNGWRWLDRLPASLTQLRWHLLTRHVKGHAAEFDVLISAVNEMDFGRPGIQYVHYPWLRWTRPEGRQHWYHADIARRLYHRLATSLSGFDIESVKSNIALCNSSFVRSLYRETYGTEGRLLYPPALGEPQPQPWVRRENRFVMLGRLAPEKRFGVAIEILRSVRARGHAVTLTIIASEDHPDELERLQRIVAAEAWVDLRLNHPREQVDRLLSGSRFGIHCMQDEHFGMAVSELLLAGCIPFVHNSGGPVEIVGARDELCFNEVDDAIDRICAVLKEPQAQLDILAALATRRSLFTREAFVQGIRQCVNSLVDEPDTTLVR